MLIPVVRRGPPMNSDRVHYQPRPRRDGPVDLDKISTPGRWPSPEPASPWTSLSSRRATTVLPLDRAGVVTLRPLETTEAMRYDLVRLACTTC